MRKQAPLPGFPEYLRQAIPMRGYQTPTDFARDAGISSSVISRWLNGQVRPDVPLLERIAPYLGAKLSTLVRLAYPEIDDGLTMETAAPLHPLAAELDRRLGPTSTLPPDEQQVLERIIDSVLTKYRARPSPRDTRGVT